MQRQRERLDHDFHVYLSEACYQRVATEAQRRQRSISSLIRYLLERQFPAKENE